jgi:hypothetical protein
MDWDPRMYDGSPPAVRLVSAVELTLVTRVLRDAVPVTVQDGW